jgi:hypothetical protein
VRSFHAVLEAAARHVDEGLSEEALPAAFLADAELLGRVPESDEFRLVLTE